jgi:hypothetical protein
MQSAPPPIDLPEDLRCGLDIAAGESGKTPSDIVVEAGAQGVLRQPAAPAIHGGLSPADASATLYSVVAPQFSAASAANRS